MTDDMIGDDDASQDYPSESDYDGDDGDVTDINRIGALQIQTPPRLRQMNRT